MGLKNKKNTSVHARINYKGKLLNSETPFAVTEAFKALRTNLMYTSGNDDCPVYGIVSSFQATGKSLIAANTAIAFSLLNKRVLLIDADMRKPVQRKLFDFPRVAGLSELLSGQATKEEVVQSTKDYPNLEVLTAGNIPPNPQELLASERMKMYLQSVKKEYDVVIIDLPPVAVVADAMAISGDITGYIFVVRAEQDDRVTFKQTLITMENMNCNILGVVLNDINLKTGNYKSDKYNQRKYNDYYSEHHEG